ncbi:hypothetical protein LHJ74_00190 [Streptomyces sp. N2-109]|uniref:Transposase n=1 Tax=Streptomyces gossypii TaxID=2883101 RepID=A0ABT2JKI0_9ACTN|nr:hypothetical protein [Streptomyces gossypii]MCT2588380.1 hypothetical protein [Streptomyces gossypii]
MPTDGAVAGRQWVPARVRMPTAGPGWWLHRRDCWQIIGEHRRVATVEAVQRVLAG